MKSMPIMRVGHPVLRQRSRSVTKKELRSKRFQQFLLRLATTCKTSNGVGIAAPQVGIAKRIIVISIDDHNPRYIKKTPFPLTIVVNPRIVEKSATIQSDWEGDLSVDLRALVPRHRSCIVEGLSPSGEKVHYVLDDPFHARVFQHEIDHLNGILFLDRVTDKKSICETAMWRKYHKPRILIKAGEEKNTN